MAQVHPTNDYLLGPFLIANVSSASQSQKLPVPMKGQIVQIHACQTAATTSAAGELTVRKEGTKLTGVVLAIPVGDAGDVNKTEISPNLVLGAVDEGEELDIDTNGGTSTSGVVAVFLVIRQ